MVVWVTERSRPLAISPLGQGKLIYKQTAALSYELHTLNDCDELQLLLSVQQGCPKPAKSQPQLNYTRIERQYTDSLAAWSRSTCFISWRSALLAALSAAFELETRSD